MRLRELGKSVGGTVLRQVGRVASNVQERRPIPVDLLESDDAYLAVFDAAGAVRSDVQVRFSRGTVHVRIDRFRERREDYEMRVPGRGLSLDGSVDLPADAEIDPTAADATLTESGTLEVYLPKVRPDEQGTPDDGDEAAADDESLDVGTRQ